MQLLKAPNDELTTHAEHRKVTKISTQDLIYDEQDDRYMSVMLPPGP